MEDKMIFIILIWIVIFLLCLLVIKSFSISLAIFIVAVPLTLFVLNRLNNSGGGEAREDKGFFDFFKRK